MHTHFLPDGTRAHHPHASGLQEALEALSKDLVNSVLAENSEADQQRTSQIAEIAMLLDELGRAKRAAI